MSPSEWRVIVLACPPDGARPLQLIDEADRADEAIEMETRLRNIMAHRIHLAGGEPELAV